MELTGIIRELPSAEEWREIFRRQEGSGVSIGKFCAAEGLKENTYYQWKRRLRGQEQSERGNRARRPRGFVEVTPAGVPPVRGVEQSEWAVELVLSSGTVVKVRG